MADGVTWIWGVLKGDWGGERSDSQIIADAVLGFVPFLGQVLDIRDLAACIYALNNNKDRTPTHQKWVALTLAIFGTIPGAGDVAKASLKNHPSENQENGDEQCRQGGTGCFDADTKVTQGRTAG